MFRGTLIASYTAAAADADPNDAPAVAALPVMEGPSLGRFHIPNSGVAGGFTMFLLHANQAASDRTITLMAWVYDTTTGIWLAQGSGEAALADRVIREVTGSRYRDCTVFLQATAFGGATVVSAADPLRLYAQGFKQ